jgi:hypothetical protein
MANAEDGANQFPDDPFTLEQRRHGASKYLINIVVTGKI